MRFPLAPLLSLPGWSMSRVREVAPCNGTEYRLRVSEGVTEGVADRLAVEAGYHPANVWPEWWVHVRPGPEGEGACDEGLPLQEQGQPCAECQEFYKPSRTRQLYCSQRCGNRARNRVWKRQKYAQDPAYRAARRAEAKGYYAECGEYVRAARKRRYYATDPRFSTGPMVESESA